MIFPLRKTLGGTLALLCVLALPPAAHGQFETRGAFPAQQYSRSIAVGDFNHDGKLDLAVALSCCPDGSVAILLGNGDGTFRPPVNYAAGVGPISIVAADFNHDGNLDLAVANAGSTYISILMGNGDGTFQPATPTPPLSSPATFVAIGDFNGDGVPDLVALCNNPAINVLLGNGDGTFQNAVTTEPSFAVQAMGVGDFNGDGKSDLATSGQFGSGSGVNILIGNGDGTFTVGASYTGDSSPSSVAVADFNGDHKLDFAVANLLGGGYTGSIGVFLGNGDGTFQPGVNYATSFPIQVAAAQLNGGGTVDLAVANFDGGASVLMGNGDGTFQTASFYPEGKGDDFVAIGDFNGDRKPDLALANGGNYVTALLNTGVVSFSPTTPLNFKKQAVGTTSPPQTVSLTNTGSKALRIASMKASSEFAVTSTCGSTVAAGAKCTISVTFSPTQKGAKQGTITIIDSASTKPQVIEVLGTGT